MSDLGPRVARRINSLWHLGGEFFDLDEERPVVVDADAVNEEDDSTRAGDGDEHPGVDSETEDRGLRHGCTVIDQ